MRLETSNLERGVVKTLVDVIGHRLARDSNNRPNVIRAYPSDNANDKGLKPNQPFIVVHCQDAITPYGWVMDKFVEDDIVCYRVAFQIPTLVTVNGKGAHDIMLELKQRLEMSTTREFLFQNTGTSILDTGSIPNDYTYLNTDYENSAPLVITLVTSSVIKDPLGELIERVVADGELVYKEGQEPPEFMIHLDVNNKNSKGVIN